MVCSFGCFIGLDGLVGLVIWVLCGFDGLVVWMVVDMAALVIWVVWLFGGMH